METWKKFANTIELTKELETTYYGIRKFFQEEGWTQEDIKTPPFYSERLMSLSQKFFLLQGEVRQTIRSYGFDVDKSEVNEFIMNKLRRIDDETPLKGSVKEGKSDIDTKLVKFQNAIDMAFEDIIESCKDFDPLYDYNDNICGDLDSVRRVEVVTVNKTEPYAVKGMFVLEIGIIFYVDSDNIKDMGGVFWNLEHNLINILGGGNFKLKLLNVVGE